jgi:hypothetical protein
MEVILEIDLPELTAPFERCILETEQVETQGNCFTILIPKMY